MKSCETYGSTEFNDEIFAGTGIQLICLVSCAISVSRIRIASSICLNCLPLVYTVYPIAIPLVPMTPSNNPISALTISFTRQLKSVDLRDSFSVTVIFVRIVVFVGAVTVATGSIVAILDIVWSSKTTLIGLTDSCLKVPSFSIYCSQILT